MTHGPYIYAVINPLLWSFAVIIYRVLMPRGADPKTLMIYTQLGGAALIAIFAGMPNYLALDQLTLFLMLLAGLSWGLGVYLEISALEFLDAAVVGVVGALRYVLIVLIGIFIFSEPMTLIRFTGIALIILAILATSNFSKIGFKKGFLLQVLAVVPQVAGYAIDKHLTATASVAAIAISSFFFPGMLFLILSPKRIFSIGTEIKRVSGLSLLIPFLLAGTYYATVTAFSLGDFVPIMAIAESSLILIWILGYFVLGERDRPLRSFLSCVVCAVGVVMVCS